LLDPYKPAICLSRFNGDQFLAGFDEKIVQFDVKDQTITGEFNYADAWTICKVNDSLFFAGSFTGDTIALINANTGHVAPINNWKGINHSGPMMGYAGDIKRMDAERFVIACRYSGLSIVNVKDSSYQQIMHDPGNASSLKSNFLRKVHLTRDGTLFVTGPGISYTSLQTPQLSSVPVLSDEKGEKYKGVINCFMEDAHGHMWLGTNNHLVQWNRQTNTSHYYPFYYDDNGPQKLRTIRTIFFDKNQRLWAGVFSAGLAMLKPDGNFEKIFPPAKRTDNTLPGEEILATTKTKDGRFLISCEGGFCFFTPETKKFETFYDHPKLKPVTSNITYYAMTDRSNNLWLAQRTGLCCYNNKADSLIKIPLPEGTTSTHIFTIAQDSSGNIYAGGYHGVYVIPSGSFTIEKTIDSKAGLETDYTIGLLCDRENKLWIIGNRGLARYDPETAALETFNAEDGLLQSNHKIFAYYLSSSNEIFIGNEEGFNYFSPAKVKYTPYPLKVFITSLQLPDTLLTAAAFSHLVLPYRNNNLSINYLAVDFKMSTHVTYRYKLQGYDTGYVYAGKQRQARYTNLPAGAYTFTAEASINGKEWYAAPTALHFIIQQVFWKTWWFISLCVLFVAAGVYTLYRYRIGQIRREAYIRTNYEIKLNELENSALRTQMNPHFIFNSLNTINAFINSNERFQANQYISKFSKLVRLTLDHSRQKRITLNDELDIVKLYMELEQMRFDKRFEFVLDLDGVDVDITEVPPMIIQPFVENAILHGLLPKKQDGLLKVQIYKSEDRIRCIIEDNGIGRKSAMEMKQQAGFKRKSHGMQITLKRIELFNKENNLILPLKIIDLENEKHEACGTRVEIEIACVESF
jgi:two-component sensor histidine kinase